MTHTVFVENGYEVSVLCGWMDGDLKNVPGVWNRNIFWF